MGNENLYSGRVLVISAVESFLAKNVVSRIEESGIAAAYSHGAIREDGSQYGHIELIILFMGDGIEEMLDARTYLKNLTLDRDRRFILIGDTGEHERALKLIPETRVLEWFKRPIDMEVLIRTVMSYMEERAGRGNKKSILVVDDDVTYMRLIYEWLKDRYHVAMASNGVQAISYLAKTKADLVLLDYEMPVANGPQVMQMLKNDSETDQIPVMFLTGHAEKERVMSVMDLKPVDYLLKSIDKETLVNKLETFFESRKL